MKFGGGFRSVEEGNEGGEWWEGGGRGRLKGERDGKRRERGGKRCKEEATLGDATVDFNSTV